MLEPAFQFRQLQAIVDPLHFKRILGLRHRNTQALLHRHGNNVGKVVFTLGIAVGERRQPGFQVFRGYRQDARVHFADLLLLGRRIFLLDD